MDPYRQQQPQAAASVNPFLYPLATSHSQHYLRASAAVNETVPVQQYFPPCGPRQPRTLPSQSRQLTRRQQQNPPSYFYHSAHHPAIMNTALNNEHQAFAPGYSAEDAKAMFAGDFDDNMIPMGPGSSFFGYHRPTYEAVPFRPLAQLSSCHHLQQIIAPSKIENRVPGGVMSLQETHVDTRQYSPVSYDDLWNTPIEADSPSTIDTEGASPATPALDHHRAYFADYSTIHSLAEPRVIHSSIGDTMNQTSFGSFTSESSRASYPPSRFSAASLPREATSSDHSHGLAIDFGLSHTDLAASAPANPSFDPYASDLEESQSEGESGDDAASDGSPPSSVGTDSAVRSLRDQMLKDMRAEGLSYKEIKRRGNFKEAESTLRGRMRMLTKQKHERVRKPLWEKKDIDLLRRAVRLCDGKTRNKGAAKMPWLKISKWILDNGASYAFAPATCAKKWSEIARR